MKEENTIEIGGEKYIRYGYAKELKSKKIRDIIILFLIAVTVVALVVAIGSIVKNADIINKDALIIGMDRHEFVSCQCIDINNENWYSTQSGFTTKTDITNKPIINYAEEFKKIEVVE